MRAIRIAELTRTSRSAISVPKSIVRPTLAIVKTTVRFSVSQKTWSWRTELKLSRPIHLPECWISSRSVYFSSEIRTRL